MTYKLGSLFDGSGGFPLSGALCGIEPVWAAEVEPYPIAVTRTRFPNMRHLGDISKVNGADIEPVDIITFGSPCQDLSVAGKRAGLKHEANGDEETTRSGLFMEAVRIIKEMREATNGLYPRFALWENVPGAFSSNKGEDFRIVCEELIKVIEPRAVMPEVPEKGWAYADSYIGDGWSLAYRVFDAQYWGVPQRRRRIHLVVDFRGECAREVLFEREGVRGYFAEVRTAWQSPAANAQDGTGADDCAGEGFDGYNGDLTGAVSATLGVNCGVSTGRNGVIERRGRQLDAVNILNPWDSQGNQVADSTGVHSYPTLRGCGGAGYQAGYVLAPTSEVEAVKNLGFSDPSVIDVEVEVAVRKHEVNCEVLCECLRDHKAASNLSNKEIAEQLDLPLTLVEHWFRRDKSFTIPDPNVWPRLKELLQIKTTEFDAAVTEFEYKGGNYDMRNRIYTGDIAPTLTCGSGNNLHLLSRKQNPVIVDSVGGQAEYAWEGETAPTLKASHYKCPPLIAQAAGFCTEHSAQARGIGFQEETAPTLRAGVTPACVYEWHNQDSRIKGPIDVACTLNTNAGGREGHLVAIPTGPVVFDGANVTSPINASNPQPGDPCHTLSTDSRNLLVDPVFCLQCNGIDRADTAGCNGKGWKEDTSYTLNTIDRPAVAYATDVGFWSSLENKSHTLLARQYKDPHLVTYQDTEVHYIVRRLTPTECARLQGFADHWGHIEKKDSFTPEEYEFWLTVRNTHAAINGKKVQDYTEAQMLTWYNKLHTDSAEYKMWGNGIALPPALYCMQGVVEAMNKADDDWLL